MIFWQLPQWFIGLICVAALRALGRIDRIEQKPAAAYIWHKGDVCWSLGYHLFLGVGASQRIVDHELGHDKQSTMLGPLYLIIIGIPSALWFCWWTIFKTDYYWFYTEAWADKLSGIKRS